MARVVNTLNYHDEKTFKSMRALLLSYFTQPVHVLPQSQPQFYKFNIGETVRMDVLPNERKSLAFKYSLNPGNILNVIKNNFFYSWSK